MFKWTIEYHRDLFCVCQCVFSCSVWFWSFPRDDSLQEQTFSQTPYLNPRKVGKISRSMGSKEKQVCTGTPMPLESLLCSYRRHHVTHMNLSSGVWSQLSLMISDGDQSNPHLVKYVPVISLLNSLLQIHQMTKGKHSTEHSPTWPQNKAVSLINKEHLRTAAQTLCCHLRCAVSMPTLVRFCYTSELLCWKVLNFLCKLPILEGFHRATWVGLERNHGPGKNTEHTVPQIPA